jgi:hypothetical protein
MQLASTRVSLDDDLDRIVDYFHSKGYTDGLPIVPPTEARVRAMLAGTRRRPEESLGRIQPTDHEATVEKVAINAVMAGCRPEYMPVLIAALEIMTKPEWLLGSMQSTTNPLTPMLILNGPIRARLKVNCGAGAMGPGWQANASIGRAIRLVMLNVGGAAPGDVDKCTQGFVGKYGLCIGENEEESPWAPLHVRRGFRADQSVVTAVGVNSSTNIHDSSDRWEDLLKTLTASLISPGTANVVDPYSTPVIAFNPLHARILSDAGYTAEKLQQHIFKNCRIDPDELSGRRTVLRRGEHGIEVFAVDGQIPFTNQAEQIMILVTGSMAGGHSCYLPNGHFGYAGSKAIAD